MKTLVFTVLFLVSGFRPDLSQPATTQDFGKLAVFVNGKWGEPTMSRKELESGVVSLQSTEGRKVSFEIREFTIRMPGKGSATLKGNSLKPLADRIRRLRIGNVVTVYDVKVKDARSGCYKNSPIVITVR